MFSVHVIPADKILHGDLLIVNLVNGRFNEPKLVRSKDGIKTPEGVNGVIKISHKMKNLQK